MCGCRHKCFHDDSGAPEHKYCCFVERFVNAWIQVSCIFIMILAFLSVYATVLTWVSQYVVADTTCDYDSEILDRRHCCFPHETWFCHPWLQLWLFFERNLATRVAKIVLHKQSGAPWCLRQVVVYFWISGDKCSFPNHSSSHCIGTANCYKPGLPALKLTSPPCSGANLCGCVLRELLIYGCMCNCLYNASGLLMARCFVFELISDDVGADTIVFIMALAFPSATTVHKFLDMSVRCHRVDNDCGEPECRYLFYNHVLVSWRRCCCFHCDSGIHEARYLVVQLFA